MTVEKAAQGGGGEQIITQAPKPKEVEAPQVRGCWTKPVGLPAEASDPSKPLDQVNYNELKGRLEEVSEEAKRHGVDIGTAYSDVTRGREIVKGQAPEIANHRGEVNGSFFEASPLANIATVAAFKEFGRQAQIGGRKVDVYESEDGQLPLATLLQGAARGDDASRQKLTDYMGGEAEVNKLLNSGYGSQYVRLKPGESNVAVATPLGAARMHEAAFAAPYGGKDSGTSNMARMHSPIEDGLQGRPDESWLVGEKPRADKRHSVVSGRTVGENMPFEVTTTTTPNGREIAVAAFSGFTDRPETLSEKRKEKAGAFAAEALGKVSRALADTFGFKAA